MYSVIFGIQIVNCAIVYTQLLYTEIDIGCYDKTEDIATL